MDKVELLTRAGVALAIGLLVGLEREWHARDQQKGALVAGFRTFALAGLLGGMSGAITLVTHGMVLGFVFLGFTAAFAAFHWLNAEQTNDPGATSVVAGMVTFILGAYAVVGDLVVAIASAVAMVVLLALREQLHKWVDSLRWEEIRAVLILLTMTFLLLPVLPNRTVDPWGVLNPAAIWLLAIMMGAISFGGYVAIRLFGDRLGVVMAAATGGLASSTATTLTLARLGKEKPQSAQILAAGILVAGVVMVVRVGTVATLLNRSLLQPLLAPIGAMTVVLGACAALLLFRTGAKEQPKLEMTNPLELATALKLTALISVVMLAAKLVNDAVGESGVLVVAAASGVADVDAITISMARLGSVRIATEVAAHAILLAVAVNTVSKAIMAASAGGKAIGRYVGGASLLAVLSAGAVVLLRA